MTQRLSMRTNIGLALAAIAGLTMTCGRAFAEEVTAASSAEGAVRASYEALASRSARVAAEANVDQASDAYLPRLTLSARYTRLSDLTAPSLFPFSIAATDAPAGTVSPPTASTGPVSIAPILDNYSLDATLTLPLSDYVLRLARGLEAAKRGRDAAEWEVVVADSRARLSGRIAFYEWLRAGAAVVAAKETVTEQEAHLADVTHQLGQGNASGADLLRVESAVSGAEATLAEASAQRATAESRLRTLLRLDDSQPLTTNEGVEGTLLPSTRSQGEWVAEAHRTRAELRALSASESAARAQARLARATYLPTAGAFASATYANPNPRYFPPEAQWHGTWALGASVTWTVTDIPGARASAAEAEARGDAVAAQRSALRNALTVDVVQSFQSVIASDAKVIATDKQLTSASEAHRVTRSLFVNARATTSNVLDAETDLARARLAWINARIDARVARARLDHAAGRYQATSPTHRP
jgi:outer membrane protein